MYVGGVDVLCCCWSEAVMFMEQHGYGGGLVTWRRCGLGFWGGVFLRWIGWVAVGGLDGQLAV